MLLPWRCPFSEGTPYPQHGECVSPWGGKEKGPSARRATEGPAPCHGSASADAQGIDVNTPVQRGRYVETATNLALNAKIGRTPNVRRLAPVRPRGRTSCSVTGVTSSRPRSRRRLQGRFRTLTPRLATGNLSRRRVMRDRVSRGTPKGQRRRLEQLEPSAVEASQRCVEEGVAIASRHCGGGPTRTR